MDAFTDRYNKLNDKQKQAVYTIEGPLLVVAGPGSGKTELLALRIANILKETQTSPDSILCLTFTDNGAINMRERLNKIIGVTSHKVAIHTFHSFAKRVMDEYREYFYQAFEFEVASDVDKEEVLDSAFKDLPHSSPMSSYHNKLGWAYYRDTKSRIRDIKLAGYSSSEYTVLVEKSIGEIEIVNSIFQNHWTSDRLSIKNLNWLEDLIKALNIEDNLTALAYKKELEHVMSEALEDGLTSAISSWSTSNIVKIKRDIKKQIHKTQESRTIEINLDLNLKEYENINKTKDLSEIYIKYEQGLQDRGLYDYDDMIINLKDALYHNVDLHDSLAERYTYIMIDEFQDTSNAQMDLILALTDHQANHGAPNICAVGDDDQAIYKFQGAEINNIINYRSNYWKDVKVITLDINYRSSQDIIDMSQKVAEQAKHRLIKTYTDIHKNLKSSSSLDLNLEKDSNNKLNIINKIENRYFKNKENQYAKIAEEIKNIINTESSSNVSNSNTNKNTTISVIARDHNSLRQMSRYLDQDNVEYDYAYKQNALTLAPIRDILNVMQYIASLIDNRITRDDLLIDIISAPYWNIKREDIYTLAYKVKSEHITWWEAMSHIPEINKIKDSLLHITNEGVGIPIIQMLHKLETGLGIRQYYFSDDTNRQQYYIYLEGLRALYSAIQERDIKNDWTILNIKDFIDIYDKYKITLNINNTNTVSSVTLQTAHKSKGLEYDYVYIIDADDKIWNKKKKTNIASIPKFLYQILTGPKEDEDDSIRLLYVSMTRAKTHLYISHVAEQSRHIPIESTPSLATDPSLSESITDNNISNLEKDIQNLEKSLAPEVYNIKEEEILRNILQNYQMSVTHINNYLKIEEGGPAHFFKENLLRFPQPMSSSAAYGSAIHDAIESIFTKKEISNSNNKENIKNVTTNLLLEEVINKFRISLTKKRLNKIEETKLYNRGVDVLTNFYNKKINHSISGVAPSLVGRDGEGPEYMIEYNLAHDNIQVGEAHITGKLDYIYIEDGKVNVLDWKTGKTLNSWDKGLEGIEKVKAHRYKYQLMMYRLLIENSNKFKSYSIGDLGLQFVEDEYIYTLYYQHDEIEYNRFKDLLMAVWRSIHNLEFTEFTEYIPTNDYDTLKLEDLIKWEDNLINNFLNK